MAVKILPEAASLPAPSSRPVVMYDGDILDYIASKSWDYDEAIKVIKCENRSADISIISKTIDVGLFQINLSAHWDEIQGETREEKIVWLQNPINNIDFAYLLYRRNHWGDWFMSYPCHNLK